MASSHRGGKPESVRRLGERAFWRRVNQALLPTKLSFATVLDHWKDRMTAVLLNEWDLRYAKTRIHAIIHTTKQKLYDL